MTEENDASSPQEHSTTGLGAALHAARLDKGMSVRDVAEALNLHERTVAALEAEDWAALPPGPFTSGYARSCAHLLDLDPGFVESCLGTRAPTREREAPLRPQMTAPTGRRRGGARRLVVVLVLFVLLGLGATAGWWWLEQQGNLNGDPSADDAIQQGDAPDDAESLGTQQNVATNNDDREAEDAAEGTAEADDSEAVASEDNDGTEDPAPDDPGNAAPPEPDLTSPPGALEQDRSPAVGSDGEDTVAGADDGDGGQETDTDEAESADTDTPTTADAPDDDLPDLERPSPQPRGDSLADAEAAPELPDGEPSLTTGDGETAPGDEEGDREATDDEGEQGEIEVELTGPSWVEITDGSGERLLYGLIRDEGRRTLQGELPFSVVIGDVTQVDVFYQGDPVDLGVDEPGRVARVEVP